MRRPTVHFSLPLLTVASHLSHLRIVWPRLTARYEDQIARQKDQIALQKDQIGQQKDQIARLQEPSARDDAALRPGDPRLKWGRGLERGLDTVPRRPSGAAHLDPRLSASAPRIPRGLAEITRGAAPSPALSPPKLRELSCGGANGAIEVRSRDAQRADAAEAESAALRQRCDRLAAGMEQVVRKLGQETAKCQSMERGGFLEPGAPRSSSPPAVGARRRVAERASMHAVAPPQNAQRYGLGGESIVARPTAHDRSGARPRTPTPPPSAPRDEMEAEPTTAAATAAAAAADEDLSPGAHGAKREAPARAEASDSEDDAPLVERMAAAPAAVVAAPGEASEADGRLSPDSLTARATMKAHRKELAEAEAEARLEAHTAELVAEAAARRETKVDKMADGARLEAARAAEAVARRKAQVEAAGWRQYDDLKRTVKALLDAKAVNLNLAELRRAVEEAWGMAKEALLGRKQLIKLARA